MDLLSNVFTGKSKKFFERLKYKKFKNNKVKILLISSKYFLMGEIINALKELNIEFEQIFIFNKEYLTEDFIKILYEKISSFKPDFTFTINHLGVDTEGVLMSLFERIEMPLVSWYVDNPNLIIKHYKKNVSDFTTLLVWDRDNIDDMKSLGFNNVFYLPLGVDINRFKYISEEDNPFILLKKDVIFVGNSMIEKVKKSYNKTFLPEELKKFYKKIAVQYVKSKERIVEEIIKKEFPVIYRLFSIADEVNKTNFETTITWEATRIYRYQCVRKIIDFNHLIIGDRGWFQYFRDRFNYHHEVNYYSDLPYIYNIATINFNTTSLQMKNAVNQRVFDVPACRRFLITDYRQQMENLFEIGKEAICYKDIEEIPYLIDKYLKSPHDREKIVKNAYKRVLAEHTYPLRVKKIIEYVKRIYS